jgi:hypothetical protein
MKRRRLNETIHADSNDHPTMAINNYLNFVMQGESTPALKYWKDRGFEEYVSFCCILQLNSKTILAKFVAHCAEIFVPESD